MTRDTLGHRAKIGVILPSTNTVVEPEMAAMQPVGVTNHVSRMAIPNMALGTDAAFEVLMEALAGSQQAAVDGVMSCAPDHLILGLSVETFWDGVEAGRAQTDALRAELGIGVSAASEALVATLREFDLRRIAVLTPYQPVGDARVRMFLEASGVEVAATTGLGCASPVATAQVTRAALAAALRTLTEARPEAVVQVGTNLPMARLAREGFDWLGLPVLAANTVLYRDALQQLGLLDDTSFLAEWMPLGG